MLQRLPPPLIPRWSWPDCFTRPSRKVMFYWDFQDKVSNSTLPQVNRQKSARNLAVQQLDRELARAVLFDPKRNETHAASLNECDCVDFTRQRTAFKPCMHIYRVAAELGMVELKHMDRALAARINSEAVNAETKRLQAILRNEHQWGGWDMELHESFVQKNRQWRAYEDVHRNQLVEQKGAVWFVNGWPASLERCGCPDFDDRNLPCKHIYAVALLSEISLPLAVTAYFSATERDQELFFHPWGQASTLRECL